MDFSGEETVERVMAALPIRIDYQSPRYEYRCIAVGDDFLFDLPHIEGDGEIREFTNLRPYAIRDAFDAVADPASALQFLSEAGKFWPFEAVRWSQLQEWREYFQWLRQEPDDAMQFERGRKAWTTAHDIPNVFFREFDRFSMSQRRSHGPKIIKILETKDRSMLRELTHFALAPIGERISFQFRDPMDNGFAMLPRVPKFQGRSQSPFLRIEPHNIVEAIAATIFADRYDGLKFAKCKQCGKLFSVESSHGREFCPPSGPSTTSACKNAYQQKAYRERDAKAIEFLLDCWRTGLKPTQIEATARRGRRLAFLHRRENAPKQNGASIGFSPLHRPMLLIGVA